MKVAPAEGSDPTQHTKGEKLVCEIDSTTTTAIMVGSNIVALVFGYLVGQVGAGTLEKLWPAGDGSSKESEHPLRPLAVVIGFVAGYGIAFTLVAGMLRGAAC